MKKIYKPRVLPPLISGFEVPKNALSDPDGDGVPNFLDCSDNNPNKQGFLGELVREKIAKRIAPKTTKMYEEYKEKQPKRERARIETLKRQASIEEQKTRIAKAQRARTISSPRDNVDYGAFFGLGRSVTPRAAPPKAKPKKGRKKKRK